MSKSDHEFEAPSTPTNKPILETLADIPIPSSKFSTGYSPTGNELIEERKYRDGLMQLFQEIASHALLKYDHLEPEEKAELHSAYRQLVWALRPAIFQEDAHHKVDRVVFLDAIRDALVIGAIAGDATIVNRAEAIAKKSERDARAAGARAAKTKEKDRCLIVVEQEIKAIETKRRFAVSEEFAGFIRPGILRRLGVSEEKDKPDSVWPTKSTIKSWLGDIKKGKTGSIAPM